MEWSFQDGLPIWQQLYEILRREIAIGGYAPGSKMPTVTEDREILENVRRELARHQVQTYLQQMALLGYTSQEAAQLLIQEKEETP